METPLNKLLSATDEPKLTILSMTPINNVVFESNDGMYLMLDEKGFHYRGKCIKDRGKAYKLFMKFFNKANQ